MFDEETMMQQGRFLDTILAMAANFDVSITSWGRTKAHNAAVGGSTNSKHLLWLAVDLVLDADVDKKKLLQWIEDNGLMAIDEHTHIHVMVR
jgi:peptidase M15-like protein